MPGSHLKCKFLDIKLLKDKKDKSGWICQYYVQNIYQEEKKKQKLNQNDKQESSENDVFSCWNYV